MPSIVFLSQNDSTKMLEDQKMKELVHHIVDIIRKNATVDWSKRSDVRAKLRLTVRKILIKYGYPPDLAKNGSRSCYRAE